MNKKKWSLVSDWLCPHDLQISIWPIKLINELTQYSAYKLYPFSPSFLIINLAGYLTNGWMIGSSFFRFFLVNIAEFLWVVRAGEIIWEMKIEEFPLMRLFLIISVMLQSLNLAIIAGTFINSSYSFVSIFISSLSSSKKKRRFCNIFVLATFNSCGSEIFWLTFKNLYSKLR